MTTFKVGVENVKWAIFKTSAYHNGDSYQAEINFRLKFHNWTSNTISFVMTYLFVSPQLTLRYSGYWGNWELQGLQTARWSIYKFPEILHTPLYLQHLTSSTNGMLYFCLWTLKIVIRFYTYVWCYYFCFSCTELNFPEKNLKSYTINNS